MCYCGLETPHPLPLYLYTFISFTINLSFAFYLLPLPLYLYTFTPFTRAMKKVLFTCIACYIAIASFSQKEIQQIDSVMQVALRRGIFNGNIIVAQKGKVIYQQSLGSADGSDNNPLTPNLRFDVGSVSKEFNGTAMMILKEQGKLSLDNTLSAYFPEFPSWAQQIRLRHLINYTSGLPMLTPSNTDSDIYTSLLALKNLAFEPGTGYIYNHVNVYLQMRVIEKVSGQSYASFIQQYILAPAGMTETRVNYPTDSAGMARAFDNERRITPYGQNMTGWVRLPIGDFYKWSEALHQYRIISRESFAELAHNFPGGESSLGTTGFENGELIWHQHQGSNSNYEAVLYSYFPDQITILMMTNNQQMKVLPLKSTLLNILQHKPFTVPKRSLYLAIRDKILANADTGIAYYQQLRISDQETYDFSFEIGDLISTGKYLQRRSRYDDAIRIFKMAVQLDGKPADLSYGYELIGECYRQKGDKKLALEYYRNAVDKNPGNKNAVTMLEALKNGG